MSIPKFLFDYLILAPAGILDYLLLTALALLIIIPPTYAWYWTIRFLDTDWVTRFPGKPHRPLTWVVATAIWLYVFAICATALVQLPRVYYIIVGHL
jgi:uncharacterized membrane protein YidH (DUF202 family)